MMIITIVQVRHISGQHVKEFKEAVDYLNLVLGPVTYLVGSGLTLADMTVWGQLTNNKGFADLLANNACPDHVLR